MNRRGIVALLLVALTGGTAPAQVEQAVISGAVTDPSGAAIPGARITIQQLETNTVYTTETDIRGSYRSVPLRVGTYSVSAEKPGFKRAVRSGIRLSVQQQAEVDLRLEVGGVTEEVTVSADAPLLQVAEASRGEVIDNKKIVDLPLNGRDYLQLGLLTAGTNVPPPGSRFGGFSSAGMRVTHNNYLLDGMDNNSNQQAAQGRTAQVITPSIDAIQEFKVQTTNYSAEFGRNIAGVVNVVLKSGTNEFHGGAFNFLRNEKLDAKNFFDAPGEPIPPYKRNQFGGLLGGPIRRNRAFFFGDYEGTRIRTSDTTLSTVPTAREKRGDFSQSIFNRQPVRIFDPFSYDPQTRTRQEFPNAIIPASRLDPVGLNVAALYPEPNRAGAINNFLYNPFEAENTDKFDIRIDHNVSQRDTVYGRFSLQNYKRTGEGNLPAPAFGGGEGSTTQVNRSRSFVFSHSHIFSPALFNTLKLGYNRLLTKRSAPIKESLSTQIGLKGLPIAYPGLSTFSVTGFASIGTQANTPHDADSQTRQITDDLIWIRGRHTVKTGLNFSFVQAPLYTAGRGTGTFNFNGNFTRQSSNNQFGHPLADLLVGIPFNTQIASPTLANQRRRLYQGYVQDEFKATARLTLNLGVRYEYVGPWFEKYNRYANFDIDSDPLNPVLVFARPGGTRERATVDIDLNNFAPRAGIAFRLSQRSVLRTGYGIYYGGVDNYGGAYLGNNPPFTAESTLSTDSIRPTILLRDGLPPGATTANITNLRTISQDRRNLTPYSQQWNLTLEQELAPNLSFEIAYVGTKANRVLQRIDSNAPEPGPGNINARRPAKSLKVPGLDYVITPLADTFRRQWSANSNYHSLQLKAEKRLSSGLSFLASYIWSKAISDACGDSAAGSTSAEAQNPRDLRAEKALADEHFPHRFVLSYNYDLPFGRGRRFLSAAHPLLGALAGGWAIGGITTLNSGRRVTVGVQGNPSNTGTSNRPNATGISPKLGKDERSLDRWFNTAAFVANPPYTYGNVSRNILEAPGLVNLDFAAYRLFQPAENLRLQFRAEFFNLTNTPFFGAPGATLGTGQFGVINSAGPARIIQFGLKLNF